MQELRGWFVDSKGDTDLHDLHLSLCARYNGDNTFESGSPILDISTYNPKIRPIILKVNDHLCRMLDNQARHEDVQQKIRLAWVDNMHICASAHLRPGRPYFITLNTAVIFILQSFFSRLMASPTFLPEVGDVSKEISQAKIKIARNVPALISSGSAVSPYCKTRKFFSGILFYHALHYLLLHEFTHIANAHMLSNVPDFDKKALDLHTKEMDADSGAVVKGFNCTSSTFLSGNKILDADDKNHVEKSQIINVYGVGLPACGKVFSLAMVGLFSLFGSNILTPENKFLSLHPHPYLRLRMAVDTLYEHIKRIHEDSAIKIGNAAYESWVQIYEQLDLSEGTSAVLNSGLEFDRQGHTQCYIDDLNRYWANTLHNDLNGKKLTKFKLALPIAA